MLNLDANSKTIMELKRQLMQVNGELDKANKHIEFLSELKESKGSNGHNKGRRNEEELEMPVPAFGKRMSETTKMDYNSTIS